MTILLHSIPCANAYVVSGVGYGVARKVELFGEFAWNKAEASELSVGNVASLDLRAAFGDYTEVFALRA